MYAWAYSHICMRSTSPVSISHASPDELIGRSKLIRSVINDGFVVMHIGMREEHLLQEDNAADTAIKLASELLMAHWKPTAAFCLEKEAEDALVEIDYLLVDFRQAFRV